MPKTCEELATEITVAWINAVGDACAAGKFNGSWLNTDSVTDFYKSAFNAVSSKMYPSEDTL